MSRLKLIGKICIYRISLARSIEDIPRDQNLVVQEYIDKVRRYSNHFVMTTGIGIIHSPVRM